LKAVIHTDQYTDPRAADIETLNLYSLSYCWDIILEELSLISLKEENASSNHAADL